MVPREHAAAQNSIICNHTFLQSILPHTAMYKAVLQDGHASFLVYSFDDGTVKPQYSED